jgi:hypothetical protein
MGNRISGESGFSNGIGEPEGKEYSFWTMQGVFA